MHEEEINFRNRIHKRLLKILHKRPRTFNQILRRSFNCDPAVLITILQELQDANLISIIKREKSPIKYGLSVKGKSQSEDISDIEHKASGFSNSLTHSKKQYLKKKLEEVLNSVPEPTPVYSQWWFSSSIYEDLIKLLLQLSKPRTSTAFIGAGTLGSLFSHFSTEPISIYDIDEVLLKEIKRHSSKMTQVIRYNVSSRPDVSFRNTFKLVFVDPPWSSNLLRTFLVRSSTFVTAGGCLAMSFPPILTRPSMETERKDLLRLAKSLGLSLKLKLIGFTEYSVPLFEQIAYENYNIHLTEPWRRGDLFLFTKTGASHVDIESLIETTSEWDQYHFDKCRLFLKRDGLFEDGLPSIETVPGLEDYTYKSTSSRMPSWKSASLISTRNRVAHAMGRKKLSFLLEKASKKIPNFDKNTSFVNTTPETRAAIHAMLNVPNFGRK